MNIGPNQEKWLTTLETAEYAQDIGSLCENGKYCCLGVAAEIFECNKVIEQNTTWFDDKVASAPDKVIDTLKLYSRYGDPKECEDNNDATNKSLASLNDNATSFEKIASIIRQDPERYFSKLI